MGANITNLSHLPTSFQTAFGQKLFGTVAVLPSPPRIYNSGNISHPLSLEFCCKKGKIFAYGSCTLKEVSGYWVTRIYPFIRGQFHLKIHLHL
jgi:hypothetical protein